MVGNFQIFGNWMCLRQQQIKATTPKQNKTQIALVNGVDFHA